MAMLPMHRQVLLLASAQALFQTVSVLVMTVGGLAGGRLASDPSLATAPIAAMFLGTAIATIPASALMARIGRRIGFILGASTGVLGGLVGATGLWLSSLPLFCFGTFLVGVYQGFAQFYRFAASEVADDAFRPRAISFVLAGGVVAAILGPELGRLGGPLLTTAYSGSFLILALVSTLATILLAGLRIPRAPQPVGHDATVRPLVEIIRQPTFYQSFKNDRIV